MRLRPHTSAVRSWIVPVALWQGLHEYETHRVPAGAVVLDAKYCELCGCNFLRRKQSKDRYCSKCLLTVLTVNREKDEKVPSQLVH
jgi:hypothetical protein